MDLRAEAQRLILDVIAVECSDALRQAGIPHALLKGPSTSLWLYDPPRLYSDVDLLVPFSEIDHVVAVLAERGVAGLGAGTLGEIAPHSLLLKSSRGGEVDLHVTLPTLTPDGDLPWRVLGTHLERLDLGIGSVPVLDEAARCLVIALHALNNGPMSVQPIEDLRRAQAVGSRENWAVATRLAKDLNADDLFVGALQMIEGRRPPAGRAYLYFIQAPGPAFGLARLAGATRRELPKLLYREAFPSRSFMKHHDPAVGDTERSLLRAYARRWCRIARQLPAAVSALVASRRQV